MEKMKEKRYLNWFNMIGYGSGDMAANFVYSVIMNFVLIVMTDSVGLSAGIVATLIAVSKVLDGVSDVFFGHLLDKTHTKMGKAAVGIYYMKYILGDENLYGTFSIAMNLPMIIGLLFVPIVIQKTGVYKANIWGYAGAAVFRGLFGVFGLMGNIPLMLICMAISQIFSCPVAGDLNAVIADVSEYTFLTSGKRIDGTIFSCSSVGIKIGSAIGTVVAGWMLEAGGYVANAVTQTPECISMLKIMYLLVPFILNTLLAVVMVTLNVSKANDKLRTQKA